MIFIKNIQLATLANALGSYELKGKASRGRTRLIRAMNDKYEELKSDLNVLQEQHNIDPNEPLPEDTTEKELYLERVDAYNAEADVLFEEEVYINTDEYPHLLAALYSELEDYNHELSGQDALLYDTIMTLIEEGAKNEQN